jgi:hypothetical protein
VVASLCATSNGAEDVMLLNDIVVWDFHEPWSHRVGGSRHARKQQRHTGLVSHDLVLMDLLPRRGN